ncbi:MAG: response regulator [Archangium sp.]|nr:response regulator [Archangium sp.]
MPGVTLPLSTKRPLKVLIVEDMLTIRLLLGGLIKSTLRDRSPLVTEAADGEQGLAAARRDRPDIIITDIGMPRMDGLELCRRLKEDPDCADIAVVMMTSDPRHREDGLAVGAAAFLQKPIRERDLVDALRVALSTLDARPPA